MQLENETKRVIENAIELASDCLCPLQRHYDVGRNALIVNCIIPWAVEAEEQYQKKLVAEEDVPYYDFIIAFGAEKLREEFGNGTESVVPR